MKNKNLIYGILVFAGIGAISTIAFIATIKREKRENNSNEGSQQGGGGLLDTISNIGTNIIQSSQTGTSTTSTGGEIIIGQNAWKAGYISEKPNAQYNLVVHFAVPRPDVGFINKNSNVQLLMFGKYNGTYKVFDIWQDDSGKLGAIYLKSDKVTEENATNRQYENKGIIKKL